MRWFWGLFFIIIGVFVLGINFDWWKAISLNDILIFWPALLILFGIAIVARNWRFGWIAVLFSFLLFVAFLAMIASNDIKGLEGRDVITTTISENITSDATAGKIDIKTGAIELNIDGETDKFIEGTAVSSFSSPDIQVKNTSGLISADIKTTQKKGFYCCGNFKNTLDLKLNNKVPIDLKVDAGATSLDFNLEKIILNSLDINAGASSLKIKIGPTVQSDASINIKAGASSLELSIPREIGIDLTVKTGMSSKEFGDFDTIDNNHYKSRGFDSATKKISINLETGVSSLKIERQ